MLSEVMLLMSHIFSAVQRYHSVLTQALKCDKCDNLRLCFLVHSSDTKSDTTVPTQKSVVCPLWNNNELLPQVSRVLFRSERGKEGAGGGLPDGLVLLQMVQMLSRSVMMKRN